MPRQRIDHHIQTYDFPDDFPERLKGFQEESGLSWAEIARRIGTYRHTVWRWKEGRSRPNTEHMIALLDLADSMGIGRSLLTELASRTTPTGTRPGR